MTNKPLRNVIRPPAIAVLHRGTNLAYRETAERNTAVLNSGVVSFALS